jgi:hypothetical protein
MTLNLVKLSVGIETIEHLAAVQESRRVANNLNGKFWHQTRQRPTRDEALLDGGSIYWIIKGVMRVRQLITGLETIHDEEGIRRCRIILDPILTPTTHRRRRPFQGWRYLESADAPPDLGVEDTAAEMPAEMLEELRALGLL